MTEFPTASCSVASTHELIAIYNMLRAYLECVDMDTHPTDPVPCDAEALFGLETLSPIPAPTPALTTPEPTEPTFSPTHFSFSPTPAPVTYCQEGYDDYGVRYNWGIGKITIATSHEACSARCSRYSGPEYNGGCKAYQTGMYFGFLYCRSYGGNLRTTVCAPWAVPTNSGYSSGALGSRDGQTGNVNVGGNCCSNTTFVVQTTPT